MDTTDLQFTARLFSIFIFLFLTLVGLVFSIYLMSNASSMYTYAMAIIFLLLSIVSGFFNTASAYWYYRSYYYDAYLKKLKSKLLPLRNYPTVAIAVPAYNESPDLVTKNLTRLMQMDYPKDKMHFYLLDDSTDQKICDKLKKFAASKKITYMHRKQRTGYKAGALNNMLKQSKEEFLAIFDYDEYLTETSFLKELMPYFQDKKLSYIQTTKKYADGTLFSDTVTLFDAFFFKFVQPSRALNNTAVFAGSCGLIRRESIDAVGGFPEYIIEDTFFSFESDMNCYSSLYMPKVYALGKPIMTFSELAKQQWRYNYGDTQFLAYFLGRRPQEKVQKKLPTISKLDYLLHGLGFNYLSIVLILFTLTALLIAFSSISIAHISLSQIFAQRYLNFDLELFGVIAFIVSVMTPILLTKIYFGSVKKGFMLFLVNFALAFIRAKAAFNAVFNLSPKAGWVRARLGQSGKLLNAIRSSSTEIVFSIFLILFGTIAIAISNFSGGVWLLWYGILYSSTFFFFYKYG